VDILPPEKSHITPPLHPHPPPKSPSAFVCEPLDIQRQLVLSRLLLGMWKQLPPVDVQMSSYSTTNQTKMSLCAERCNLSAEWRGPDKVKCERDPRVHQETVALREIPLSCLWACRAVVANKYTCLDRDGDFYTASHVSALL